LPLSTCQTKPPVPHHIVSPPDQPERHPVQRPDQPLARAIITSITSTASSVRIGSVPPISKGKSKGRTTGDGPGKSHCFAGWNQGRIGAGEREIIQQDQRARRAFLDSPGGRARSLAIGFGAAPGEPPGTERGERFLNPIPAKKSVRACFLVAWHRKVREKPQK
jgi:hypothetical protein